MGSILFSRSSSSRLVWLGAFMLPTFAASAVSTANFPPIVVPNWLGSLAKTISVIGQITFVVFFFIFRMAASFPAGPSGWQLFGP